MTGGSRIVAFGPGSDQTLPEGQDSGDEGVVDPREAEEWLAEEEQDERPSREWPAPALAFLAVAGWTGFFAWALHARLAAGIAPAEGAMLVGDWALPVLLIGVVWLIVMRSSRREASRFADVAATLSAESRLLEDRLVKVNGELSLAREFIAAQSRDLDSLGRIAAERISEHADRLQALIVDNGRQVESIAGVSTTALDNMEQLRGQLPVVASAARDVANNIGLAGRTAQGTLDELAAAFSRLAASGADSAARVEDVKAEIDRSLELFQQRLEQLQAVVGARLEELEHRGEDLRARLSASESAALMALRERAATMASEIDAAREMIDGNEAQAITSLRDRIGALRDETGSLGRTLREREGDAMRSLDAARQRMEDNLKTMLERVDKLDRDALEAARSRITTLSQEAGEFDNRLAERNRQFMAETEERLAAATARHDAEIARLAELFGRLDAELETRRTVQTEKQQELADSAESIAASVEGLSERIAAIAAYGNKAEETLGANLRLLTDRITANRDALASTGASVEQLTDGAVRLLELLQASTEQSRDQLPAALQSGEKRLAAWEGRLASLREEVENAAIRSDELSATTAGSHSRLVETMQQIASLQATLDDGVQAQGAALGDLRASLAALDSESRSLAADAQERLTGAIEQLGTATRAAVNTLTEDSRGAVSTLAERIGEQSAEAIERAMRVRLAEAVGQLEQAAGHAAGISREAAIQLRDQLAKVDELAGNLERRVARARERAEEQVDNDFARRVALITESLNSNAIDIAKALSTEVTDTAWAAYLRGDRGVFTRRAVKLVDVTEMREIARIYEDDSEFRDHVSRYIHDFEAMLRQLLSTRDGHSLGVTLLPSDMGKLYVILAQAIERLRT